jgi:hypothetical protein
MLAVYNDCCTEQHFLPNQSTKVHVACMACVTLATVERNIQNYWIVTRCPGSWSDVETRINVKLIGILKKNPHFGVLKTLFTLSLFIPSWWTFLTKTDTASYVTASPMAKYVQLQIKKTV